MAKKKFPTFPVVLLIVSFIWFVSELGLLRINIPWIPIILMVVSIGWIINRYQS